MIYVDDMRARFGQMRLSHMIADTEEELHAMADKIGVKRKWFQASPPHSFPHYDISEGMKFKAEIAGAVRITWRQAGAMCYVQRMWGGDLPKPEEAEAKLAIIYGIRGL